MKKTISYKTKTGTTGEIFLDQAEFSGEYSKFTVTSNKMETIKARVVDSKDHGGCLKVIPAKPLEIKGKKYGHIIIADPVAAREFKEAFDEMYEVYKWEKQTIVTETDKEQLAKPAYFFYDGWEFKADMYEKVEITDADVARIIEKYFADIDAEAVAEREAEEREEKRREELINKAKETGEPQLLFRRFAWCDDPKEECDVDVIAGYIDADGNVEVTKQHLY